MKKRYCRVTLINEQAGTQKYYENLAVSFEVATFAGGDFSRGVVRIAGLSTDTIQEFTMFTPDWTKLERRKILKLDVGYINESGIEESSTILNGYIERAIPMALPDRVMVINVISTLNTSFEEQEIYEKNITLASLIRKLAQSFTLGAKVYDYTGRAEFEKLSYVHKGNLQSHLKKINNAFDTSEGYAVWYNLNQFYIGDKKRQTGKLSTIQIGGNGGLIIYGIPTPYAWGCIVRTEIVNTLRLYNHFQLNSTQIPSMNGEYNPFAITYVGETRGQNWYAEVSANVVQRSFLNGF